LRCSDLTTIESSGCTLHDRRPAHRSNLVHHGDHRLQCVSIEYSESLAEAGIECRVDSVGNSNVESS